MDTVPADPSGRWIHGSPWSGALQGRRIYGRGSVERDSGVPKADRMLELGLPWAVEIAEEMKIK